MRVADDISNESIIEYRVPQGARLGTNFISYLYKWLFLVTSTDEIVDIADDTAFFYHDENWVDSSGTDFITIK